MLRNAKVGDKVYTRNGAIGVITGIAPNGSHPVFINFSGTGRVFTFTYEGIFSSNYKPSHLDIKRLIPQQEQTSTPTPSSSVEYLSDLNVHIYHSPNGQSFQIYPQLKDKYVI